MMDYIGIENFRNHKQFSLETSGKQIIAIIGKNGLGKTNILEAISIIDGSKGLRGAKISEMKQNSSQNEFKICADIDGNRVILESQRQRKKFTLNSSPLANFFEVSNLVSTIWSTPELEYLFFSSSKTRRNFFDKITFCFFNNHYSIITKADDLLTQRLNILTNNQTDGFRVIDKLEQELATLILQIIKNRNIAIEKINKELKFSNWDSFESFSIKQLFNNIDFNKTNEELEIEIRDLLKQKRQSDSFSGRSFFSHNRVNIDILFENSFSFERLSSGQIKFVLITICFAFAKVLKQTFAERSVLLLLDDFISKLDYKNSQKLLTKLESWVYGQVFITSTSGLAIKDDDKRYKIIYL